MTDHAVAAPPAGRSLTSYIYDPKFRGLFFQALTLVITIFVGWWIFDNTTENLARSNTASVAFQRLIRAASTGTRRASFAKRGKLAR